MAQARKHLVSLDGGARAKAPLSGEPVDPGEVDGLFTLMGLEDRALNDLSATVELLLRVQEARVRLSKLSPEEVRSALDRRRAALGKELN